jgi:glycine oxidase
MRIVVAGAGAFGSAIALELARTGARVVRADPAGVGDNASGVAAGMLAPAFEALLDPVSTTHFPLLRAARDLWPAFTADIGEAAIGLRRGGALWVELPGDPAELIEARRNGLEALGAAVEPVSAAEVAARVPGLSGDIGRGLLTLEDWRLAPDLALPALQAAARAAGVEFVRAGVTGFKPGAARLSTGEVVEADRLVMATGFASSTLAPELAGLSPIKGHILRFPHSALAADGPILRCRLGYAAGGVGGLCVGATMEAGLSDRAIDPAAVEGLCALAAALSPGLASAPVAPLAAVRATSPDGLPLVGPSLSPGVWLAVGARRNGWLLAPLVARAVATQLAGRDPGPDAGLFDPRRFSRP